MKLYLIRHGESQGNVNRGFISGRSDPNGLTTKGKAQITRTAWELQKTPLEHIYTSPVARALESATILHSLLNVPISKVDFLVEMSYGKFEGHFFWDMMDEARTAFERWNTEFTFPFPDGEGRTGESLEMVSNRVWNGYQEWIKTIDPDKKANIVLVAHDAIISTLLFCLMYGHPASENATPSYKKAFMNFVHSIDVPNGSVYIVDLHAHPIRFQKAELFKHTVPTNNTSISFYICGMEKFDKVEIKEQITASDNQVFHLKNSEDIIMKIMKEKEIVSTDRIKSIYKYLQKNTKIEAPKVLLYDETHVFFPDTVIIQDYEEGTDMSDLLTKKDCQKKLMSQAFEMLKDIHKIPVKDVEEFWYPDDVWHKVHISWEAYMGEEISLTMKNLSKSIKKGKVRANVKETLKKLNEYIQSKQSKIVPLHGDFAPQNIVAGKNDKIRILDFERARLGDTLWDFAYFYGWVQRADIETASLWKDMVLEELSEAEKEIFNAYEILFHAWTIRDIFEYKKNTIRSQRAEKSLKILEQSF